MSEEMPINPTEIVMKIIRERWLKPVATSSKTTQVPNTSTVNYKPIMRVPKHVFDLTSKTECIPDARHIFFEYAHERGVPMWASYMLSHVFVKAFTEKLNLEDVPYSFDDYKLLETRTFYRDVVGLIPSFMKDISDGIHAIPDMPNEYLQYDFSVCSAKCKRPHMEDRYNTIPTFLVVNENTKKKKDAYFAVYDGHNGAFSAAYAAAHFPRILEAHITESGDCLKELLEAYDDCNTQMSNRALTTKQKSGTTAVGAYIRDKTVYMFWCGDSQVATMNADKITMHSRCHKPELPEETARIVAAGGIVVSICGEMRVNGVLNLSRSMGEVLADHLVVSNPDSKVYDIADDDYLMILGSDGIWDVFDEESMYNHIIDFIQHRGEHEFGKLCDEITLEAYRKESTDNMTVIVVFFKSIDDVWAKFRDL